jgi:PPOX class probable F420-dependent enzyme
MAIPERVRELIATAPLVHLTTLNRDGSPQVSVVWVGIEEDEFVVGHLHLHQKVRNVRRDPQVVFSCLGTGTNAAGLREYLVVHGKARITEGGAPALLQRLARLYLRPDAVFPPAPLRDQPGWITRIRPERYGGIGPWNPARA